MARAAIYQQLNQQAAVDGLSGHLPAAQLDGDRHGGVRLHSEQEQAWARSSCRRSDALAAYLVIMTVLPGRNSSPEDADERLQPRARFIPDAKRVTRRPCVASWDRRRQDCFPICRCNLLQKAMD
jgi:hypothetical protein